MFYFLMKVMVVVAIICILAALVSTSSCGTHEEVRCSSGYKSPPGESATIYGREQLVITKSSRYLMKTGEACYYVKRDKRTGGIR